MRTAVLMSAMLVALSAGGTSAATLSANTPAKVLFSKAEVPSPGPARPIGSYADGCMSGAEALPITGPHWQVMRLSRNRNWGQPELLSFIETFSADAAKDGWNGLLVGDMAQPRGGPMITGHASHQIGLDVDIWLMPMPDHVLDHKQRETMAAQSLLVKGKRLTLDLRKWSPVDLRLYKRAASYPEVARIFASPAIKKELCAAAGTDRAWLRKIRPWYGHDDHMHVRLACPPGISGCIDQELPPPGDGCGADLAWWFRPPPPPPKHPVKPPPPPREKTLADLPAACRTVLTDEPGGVALTGGTPASEQPPVAKAN
jgi:penicillin-insensitive murein endopeptidase